MASASSLTSTASAFVKITPSGITANLVPYGTSLITRGHEQDLTLDPGRYSSDLDGNVFNASVSGASSSRKRALLPAFSPFQRTGSTSTIVASTVCPTFRTSVAPSYLSMTLASILSTPHACPIDRVRHISLLILCRERIIVDRQWGITMAIREPERLTQVVGDHPLSLPHIQSNLPVDGLHGESTKCHSPSHGLSARSRR